MHGMIWTCHWWGDGGIRSNSIERCSNRTKIPSFEYDINDCGSMFGFWAGAGDVLTCLFKAICTNETFIWINAKRTPKQARAPSPNPKYAHFGRLLSCSLISMKKPILKKSIRCLDKIYRCQIYTFNSIQLNDFSKESNAMNDKSPNEIMEKLFKTQYLQESLQRYVMNSWQYTLHIKANTDEFHPPHN